jgi:hypothetical protein
MFVDWKKVAFGAVFGHQLSMTASKSAFFAAYASA